MFLTMNSMYSHCCLDNIDYRFLQNIGKYLPNYTVLYSIVCGISGLLSSEKFVFSVTQKVGMAGFSEKLVPIGDQLS